MEKYRAMIHDAREDGRTVLTEVESKQIISEEGIEVVETRLAMTRNEAVAIAEEIGFPVALKTAAPGIIHKSDLGGVRLNLRSGAAVGRAYSELVKLGTQSGPSKRKSGVSVQKMAPAGVEVIIGLSQDPQFGPVMIFGLGGVFVEMLKDVSFRVVPLTARDARLMIEEIRGYPLLLGYRGQDAVDIQALEDIVLKVSRLGRKFPDIRELDLNPVIAWSNGAMAVDARVILEEPSKN